MKHIDMVYHSPGALGMRWLGLGPNLRPSQSLLKLERLLNKHAFWAKGRSAADLRTMLLHSTVVVTLWRGKRMVGFGRAHSDGIYRAVLWDIVVAGDLHGKGLGRQVVVGLLNSKQLKNVETIYLMTTNGEGFYNQLQFNESESQKLMIKRCPSSG